MIHPIPSGTRDVLPDELRELRAITDAMRDVFDARGFGEVSTPALEYEAVLTRGDSAAADPAYRLFDEHGNVLVLRSDMTIPIARVVATRYANSPVPLRFSYVAHAYRAVKQHRGHPREILQAGIELVGAPGPAGTAEAVSVLCATLDAAGLTGYRVGLGDASLFPRALDRAGVHDVGPILRELAARDMVGLERELRAAGAVELLDIARARGGVEVVPEDEPLTRTVRPACSRCRRARDLRPRPRPGARLLHGPGVRGLRRGFRVSARRRRPLRRPARALWAATARVRLGAGCRARPRSPVAGGRRMTRAARSHAWAGARRKARSRAATGRSVS